MGAALVAAVVCSIGESRVLADTVSAVRQQWTERASFVKAFRCRVQISESTNGMTDSTKDSAASYEYEFAFDGYAGVRLSLRHTRPVLIAETGHREPQVYTFTANGEETQILSTMDNMEFPVGYLRALDTHHFSDLDVKPLMMHFRGLIRSMGGIDEHWLQLSETGFVDGHSCAILLIRDSPGAIPLREVWVDLNDEAIVRRYLSRYADGTARHQMDITYGQDAKHSWIPKEWRLVSRRAHSSVIKTSVFRMMDYEVNPTVAKSDFDISFPVGTLLIDVRQNTERAFRLGANGERQELSSGEALRLWEQGASRVHPTLNRTSASGRRSVYVIVCALVVCVMLAVAVQSVKLALRGCGGCGNGSAWMRNNSGKMFGRGGLLRSGWWI